MYSVDVSSLEREPLLGTKSGPGRDDRERGAEFGRDGVDLTHDSKICTSLRFGSGFLIFVATFSSTYPQATA